ncbi:hydroxylacyl-CoA dehydrogenase [Mangrovimonas sp. CR14]|uniref:3-hydroxyacyl-CoA dehydrogenase NAD-binding domain-containing protein n=1 Tax=Mangrovimonas sp. CR14 TaxID=2706120 RepID=UPI0014241E97|nr:3-hydroxyacyl-CoA dehydrogenase NAD-binding domain-containing protein [Mangrovimonas sp. CR14]NIK93255.1 hydroxylacyl-CoA dehydrogenase [Mangrovimonas sp. CR14]
MMIKNKEQTVAVVGAGVIGCSWAAYYAVKGYKVNVSDVKEGYQENARVRISTLAAEIPNTDVEKAMEQVSFFTSIKEAVKGVDLVQENGPERVDIKQQMFADFEGFAPEKALLVSSSSGTVPADLSAKMVAPERALIGHPANPAHLLPVVEICGGQNTPRALVERLEKFYRDCGRVTATLNKPIEGFVINRLQTSLLREAIHLVGEGVVNVKDLDSLFMASLGVRWASIGPFLTGQLGGGEGGFRGITENILSSLFASMGFESISIETLDMLEQQTNQFYPMDKMKAFAKVRDERQKAVLEIQKSHPLPTND